MLQFAQSVVEQALGSGRHGSAKVSKQDRGKEFFNLLPDDLLSSMIGLLDVKALLCLQQCDKRLQRLAVSGICSSCRCPLCHLGHRPLQIHACSCIIQNAFNCTRNHVASCTPTSAGPSTTASLNCLPCTACLPPQHFYQPECVHGVRICFAACRAVRSCGKVCSWADLAWPQRIS
jgi:hypothetical protein